MGVSRFSEYFLSMALTIDSSAFNLLCLKLILKIIVATLKLIFN